MLLLHILLCIVLFSPCSTITSFEQMEADIVKALVETLEFTNAGTKGSIGDSHSFGPGTSRLMKVIISTIVKSNPTPGSRGYKALEEYRARAAKILVPTTKKVSVDELMKEYDDKVHTRIHRMKTIKDQYIERTLKNDWSTYKDFEKACNSSELSPQTVLDFMESRLVVDCIHPYTQEEAKLIASHRKYLISVFLRMNVSDGSLPEPGLYMSEFVRIYKQLDRDVLNQEFTIFKRPFKNYDEAMNAFFEELRGQMTVKSNEPICIFRELIFKSNYNYPYINEFVTKMIEDLNNAVHIANTCIEESPDLEEQEIAYKKIEVSSREYIISSYTEERFNESLTSAWPYAHNGILREQYMRVVSKSEHFDNRTLEIITNATLPLLKNSGLPNYVYEMMLIKTKNDDNEIHYDGMENYCSLSKEVNGYNTVIGRIPLNSTNNQKKVNFEKRMAHLRDYAITLNSTIENEIKNSHGAPTLQVLADALKEKFGEKFISEDNFHCWAIVRERSEKIGDSCPRINSWTSSYNSGNFSSITTLSYRNDGTISQRCEEFKVFFFA